jgi:hypothetical protein
MILTNEDKKFEDALTILENETYMRNSGLLRGLARKLAKLSKGDLVNLDLIIKLKILEAKVSVMDNISNQMGVAQ